MGGQKFDDRVAGTDLAVHLGSGVYNNFPFVTVDAIGNQACQNCLCHFLSNLGRMLLKTARHPSRKFSGHQYTPGRGVGNG